MAGFLLAGVAATPAHAETIRSQQWHLTSMKADDIWKTSTGKGVTVAIIDSGVDSIPELEGQVLPGKDYATSYKGDERTDWNNHGTTMAAIIAASGKHPSGDGSFGLAPGAKILPIRVPQGENASNPIWTEAIRYAADSDAKIINISMATSVEDPARIEAVKYALSKGKLIFAGVGNNGDAGNRVLYPAATPGVVGVGAIDKNGKATAESQHGPQVDLTAPGADIVTACASETQLCKNHGTSDATALASASAALIWSAHPDWTNNQVLRVMMNTAGKPVDGAERSDFVGYGVVRPRIAVPNPGDPGPADVYPLPDLAAAGGGTGTKAPSAPSSSSPEASAPAPQAVGKKDDGVGGSHLPWLGLGLGLGACLLIGGAVTAVVVRRRSR
ncbi:type VII secretion-associated serine protease mycosin [Streptomyces sp. NBC_00335]|uniref:type VII secretion-associated serine protease mycosin n=1 Tax=unclassified Streptomyces TaxID=2593676 RepID=UPI00225459BF|nr:MULTISPECIES: type VII secretion-associated serine protease mycosin [unclassified Streptomyces]MCX5406936.1 type VII secretion-associated serine protease mycosin [Streptomyces sp. NBC_00086]